MAPKRNSDSPPQSISPPPMKIAKTAGISLALTLGDGVSLALTKPVESLPKTASEFRNRLSDHGKEIYKDPPLLPITDITVSEDRAPLPTRKQNGDFVFTDYDGKQSFSPNVSPEEVLRAGAFGGTYFRSLTSSVTNLSYVGMSVVSDSLEPTWITGLSPPRSLTSTKYRTEVNKYKVKCGGSLGMWESSGWICSLDPYGWFQWYCRFFNGRRCTDDERQISRWNKCAGDRGRFRSQLSNKCLLQGKQADDATISPVIRQTLLHWGFELTEEKLRKHEKNQKKKTK